MKYDLGERTAKFGEEIIRFIKTLPNNHFTKPLISQLVRSSTSIGANYMEANQASSRKDLKNKIRISQKEANESKHWLTMIAVAVPENKSNCRKIGKKRTNLLSYLPKYLKPVEIKNYIIYALFKNYEIKN